MCEGQSAALYHTDLVEVDWPRCAVGAFAQAMRLLDSLTAPLLLSAPARIGKATLFFGSSSLPADIVELHSRFYEPTERERSKGAPARPSIEAVGPLWVAMQKAYGSDALALRAAKQNPQMINPLYTRPSTIADSKAALLVSLESEEEALTVMLQNPAVLTCGASLATSAADEIKRFAAARAFFDSIPPPASLGALVLLLLAGLAEVGFKDSESALMQQGLSAVKPS